MKRLIILLTILIILQVYQADAISMTFDSNTTITTKEVINNDEAWIIEDGVTIVIDNSVTNYGTIIIKGNLINEDIINNYGTIINNDTLVNTNRITNYGTIINNGILNNTYILNNLHIINNTGIFNNQAYIYNFGNIYNNTNNDLFALFPGLVGFNNQGLIIEPSSNTGSFTSNVVTLCNISLSDELISEGESITATVESDADAVLFEWIDPFGNIQRSIVDNSAPFSDTDAPNIHGEWTIRVICDGISDSETFTLNFNVLPESIIGAIGVIGAAAVVFMLYTKIQKS